MSAERLVLIFRGVCLGQRVPLVRWSGTLSRRSHRERGARWGGML